MRWDEQSVERVAGARLPGISGDVVERRFTAPEAMDLRFYEVQAKSALNRVPNASRVPFKWTVNPYRGCTHACVYCLHPDTPVLMANGRTKPIAQLGVGDQIYGTEVRGRHRRFARTDVRAVWQTRKRAYRVTLEDGTMVVASGDHRFLTDRGWKYVAGAAPGSGQRPRLTVNNSLLGAGAFATPPVATVDYRRGYLCGMLRGDGLVASYSYLRTGRSHGNDHRLRLALTDFEGLRRSREYLRTAGIETTQFLFAAGDDRRRPVGGIRNSSAGAVSDALAAIEWPSTPSDDWCKGFLAGVFDAEGSLGGTAVRIANTDDAIIAASCEALARFGFDHVVEHTGKSNGLRCVSVRGGLQEVLRFFVLTDPAITRKRSIEGRAIESTADLRVASIEDLGEELPMVDITTGTGDFIANGVVSHNCFARPTHEFLDMDAGRDFERRIIVKVNVPEVLRAELARPSWRREHVALGTNTDPYQWVEGRYKLMRGIWEALRDARNPCSILTKSPLVLRDVDLLREIASVADVSACLSVPTLDEKAWRATEPHTPHPRARLEAVAELNRQGIPTGILIAPLMPGVNDAPEQVERIIELATEAGAVHIGGNTLFLRGPVRRIFFDWLRAHRPDLLPRYKRLYARGAYVAEAERRHIEAAAGLPGNRLKPYPDRFKHRTGAGERARGAERRNAPGLPAERPRQEALF